MKSTRVLRPLLVALLVLAAVPTGLGLPSDELTVTLRVADEVDAGTAEEITVEVAAGEQFPGSSQSFTVRLKIDGALEEVRDVPLYKGQAEPAVFSYAFEPGEHTVVVDVSYAAGSGETLASDSATVRAGENRTETPAPDVETEESAELDRCLAAAEEGLWPADWYCEWTRGNRGFWDAVFR